MQKNNNDYITKSNKQAIYYSSIIYIIKTCGKTQKLKKRIREKLRQEKLTSQSRAAELQGRTEIGTKGD